MRYLDSIFVNEETDERIRERCGAINRAPNTQASTFDAAMNVVITAGLDALDAAEAQAGEQQAGQVDRDPLSAMTGVWSGGNR
jgi:hypothetical protein